MPSELLGNQTGKKRCKAKQEGKIFIYAALGPYHADIFAEFQKDYPEIKASILHGNSSRISPRLFAERRAGKYLADVYLGGPTSLYSFYKNSLFDPLAPLLVLPEVVETRRGGKGSTFMLIPNASISLSTKGAFRASP